MRANGVAIVAILGLTALAGCASKPVADKPSDTAVRCMAYLGLEKQAGRGDTPLLERASASWKTIALVTMSGKQVDVYYANAVAVYGAQPASQVSAEAERCLKRAPRNLPSKSQKKI
jgi:hypothetical protein